LITIIIMIEKQHVKSSIQNTRLPLRSRDTKIYKLAFKVLENDCKIVKILDTALIEAWIKPCQQTGSKTDNWNSAHKKLELIDMLEQAHDNELIMVITCTDFRQC